METCPFLRKLHPAKMITSNKVLIKRFPSGAFLDSTGPVELLFDNEDEAQRFRVRNGNQPTPLLPPLLDDDDDDGVVAVTGVAYVHGTHTGLYLWGSP